MGNSPNLYQYALFSPFNYSDPMGLCVFGLPCPKWAEGAEGFFEAAGDAIREIPSIPSKIIEADRAATRLRYQAYNEGGYEAYRKVSRQQGEGQKEAGIDALPLIGSGKALAQAKEICASSGRKECGRAIFGATSRVAGDAAVLFPAGKAASRAVAASQEARLTERLLRETLAEAENGLSAPLSKRQLKRSLGPVQSGVAHPALESPSFGRNPAPVEVHPVLQARIDSFVEATAGNTAVKAGVPGAHSEIYALSDALYELEGTLGRAATEADLSDFLLTNVSMRGRWEGVFVPPCLNCEVLIEGVNVVK